MDLRTVAIAATTLWAAWWTYVAVAFGMVGGSEREELLLAGGILFGLWAQPLLAVRGTRAAGVALLINTAALTFFLGVVGGPTTIAALFTHLLLPPAAAGVLLLSRKR